LEHGISKSISNIFFIKGKENTIVKSNTNYDNFSKENLDSPNHEKSEKINLRLFKQNVKNINNNKINKELLSAPKARRVRSNSPSVSKIKFESPSSQNSQISVNENEGLLNSSLLKPHGHKYNQNKRMKSSDNTHKSHNHLLTISKNSRLSDKSSMKSSESTNSTFSAGFLPSPEMNSPSAISLLACSGNNMNNSANDGSSKGENLDKPCVTNIALAAAKIGSSLFLTDEQQKELNDKLNEQKNLADMADMKALAPVKTNVRNERRSVPNLESPNNLLMPRKSLEREAIFSVGTPNEESVKPITNEIDNKKLSISNELQLQVHSSSRKNSCAKPGQEVLTLISTWIKNAPNDFMDTRVLDEVKHFFNQLDGLKSSFRPWTKRLKQALKLDVN
jgi:hypothetical protein